MHRVPVYRGVEAFNLHGFPRALELDENGLHHPRSARRRTRHFTPYADFTHLASSTRTLWLGTRASSYLIPRSAFVDPNGPENLVRALLARIAQSPGGSEQLARMAQVEETARSFFRLRAIWGLAVLCFAVFALQLLTSWPVQQVAYFSLPLVQDGDLWRLVTANLVHAWPEFPLHLVLNLLALFALGFLVERPLGTPRTLCVLFVSGVGAMLVSGLVEGRPVVGASGAVFGLAGSVLWLELRCAEYLPAWWRVPRRVLFVLLGMNALLPLLLLAAGVQLIAWGAHLGGFAAGLGVTALFAPRRLPERAPSPSRLRAAAAASVALVALAGWSAGQELLTGDYLARHAERMATLPHLHAAELNDEAWRIAIAPDRTQAQVEAALRLAERAVAETDREVPEILDTLAEIQFQLGWTEQAVATIDEAIAQAPDEPYYREQRRRFLGERDADDRPHPLDPLRSTPPPPNGQATA